MALESRKNRPAAFSSWRFGALSMPTRANVSKAHIHLPTRIIFQSPVISRCVELRWQSRTSTFTETCSIYPAATSVSALGLPNSIFAGQMVSSAGRATVIVGLTDAAPEIDFAANGYQDDVRIYYTIPDLGQLESVRLANLVFIPEPSSALLALYGFLMICPRHGLIRR